MNEKNLTPIPIPARQRWREFRVAWVPPLTFFTLVGLICWMWVNYVRPSEIIGEVETLHANIVSTIAGAVHELQVDNLEAVTNGQILAVIASVDGDQLRAELAAAEADLRLMKARMDIDKTRNLNAYSELRIASLDEQFNLEVARIRLQQAQLELDRAQKLLDSQLISRGVGAGMSGGGLISPRTDFGYDVALRDRDAFKSEVAIREKSVADLQAQLAKLETTGVIQVEPTDPTIEQAIRTQRENIAQLQKPIVLRSPIDGFVSVINVRAGERVDRGGIILVVSGRKSDRIVAWVHPPVLSAPHVGDVVEVRRMGMGQTTFEGTVLRVGSQLEPVSPMLRTPVANPERIEVGLPLLVKAERAIELIPGEAVQLRVIRNAGAGVAN